MDRRAFAMIVMLAAPAAAQCRLCVQTDKAEVQAAPARPLSIEVETALDMGRVAQGGHGGSIMLDESSGARTVSGRARRSGWHGAHRTRAHHWRTRPTRPDRIAAVDSVEFARRRRGGDVVELRSDLPPDPMLDGRGELTFAFGGRLIVAGNAAGDFRGRIAVTADYR